MSQPPWDDDEFDDIQPDEAGVEEIAASQAAAAMAGVIDKLVLAEVKRETRRRLQPLITATVDTALTEDRMLVLHERAQHLDEEQLTVPAASATDGSAAAPEEVPPRLYFGSVDEFVREFIVPIFRRRVGERAVRGWSAEWWRSAEAILQLEALWRSWEHLRLDPATGMSVWLRDHADPHRAALFDPDGPFATSTDTNRPGEPLPYTAPPEGLFPDVQVESADS
ncbi:MAG TPA: DUF4913 domain-containing protein [Microlunatus sp.]|nr:DUF4913 domain-containing protein [Microlunatus sp.]